MMPAAHHHQRSSWLQGRGRRLEYAAAGAGAFVIIVPRRLIFERVSIPGQVRDRAVELIPHDE